MFGAFERRGRWTFATILALAATLPPSRGADPSPRHPALPGAVEEAPAWLVGHAPFDVARYFEAPPRDQNAASGYLVALAEFSEAIEPCFPPGPEREARTVVVEERYKCLMAIWVATQENPKAVTPEAIDRALEPFEEGFHRLVLAQRRPRCLFQGALGLRAKIPHADAAVHVAQVAAMRVRREVATGDLDDAIRTLEVTLRLARDLMPRAELGGLVLATSVEFTAYREIILPILSAPGLTAAQCDRLLWILGTHEDMSVDLYAEWTRSMYVTLRVILHDFVFEQDKLAAELGVLPGGSVFQELTERSRRKAERDDLDPPFDPDEVEAPPAPDPRYHLIDLSLALTSPRALAEDVGQLDAYYTILSKLGDVPMAERLRRLPDLKAFLRKGPMDRILPTIASEHLYFVEWMTGQQVACLHATRCLIALRRWRFDHEAPPASLLDAVKAGGMVAIPADPYDAKPLRMAIIEGEPVIYSVGKDGVDDGGVVDSDSDRKPGDLIYRLQAAEPN